LPGGAPFQFAPTVTVPVMCRNGLRYTAVSDVTMAELEKFREFWAEAAAESEQN
jgi:hypothetical protein